MLSNGFAFRLCKLYKLAFRGLDLAYMSSPPGFANRDRPHARATRATFRPPARLLHARAPPSFAVKLCRRESKQSEVQDGARFMTGEDQTTRREDLDGMTTAERGMPRYKGARRAKNYRRRRKLRAKRKTFRGKKCGPKILSNAK